MWYNICGQEMRDLRSRKRGSLTGVTLLELMVAVAIIAVLLTLAVPNFINARRRAKASSCANNLKLLYEAGQLYRMEQGSGVTTVDASTLYTQGYTEEALSCPVGGLYAAWNVDNKPVCSIGTNGTSHTWDDHIY